MEFSKVSFSLMFCFQVFLLVCLLKGKSAHPLLLQDGEPRGGGGSQHASIPYPSSPYPGFERSALFAPSSVHQPLLQYALPGVFVFASSVFSPLFTYSPTCSFLFMCLLIHLSNLKPLLHPDHKPSIGQVRAFKDD